MASFHYSLFYFIYYLLLLFYIFYYLFILLFIFYYLFIYYLFIYLFIIFYYLFIYYFFIFFIYLLFFYFHLFILFIIYLFIYLFVYLLFFIIYSFIYLFIYLFIFLFLEPVDEVKADNFPRGKPNPVIERTIERIVEVDRTDPKQIIAAVLEANAPVVTALNSLTESVREQNRIQQENRSSAPVVDPDKQLKEHFQLFGEAFDKFRGPSYETIMEMSMKNNSMFLGSMQTTSQNRDAAEVQRAQAVTSSFQCLIQAQELRLKEANEGERKRREDERQDREDMRKHEIAMLTAERESTP
jgi:signal transduction histidine kinase